jgi:hypothetical protein
MIYGCSKHGLSPVYQVCTHIYRDLIEGHQISGTNTHQIIIENVIANNNYLGYLIVCGSCAKLLGIGNDVVCKYQDLTKPNQEFVSANSNYFCQMCIDEQLNKIIAITT